MNRYVVYTDGSFGDNGETHGGIAYGDGSVKIHVYTKNSKFVSMRNVGGEVIAAWAAIVSLVNAHGNSGPLEIELVYDYKGIGDWLTGAWKTNKPATIWFKRSIDSLLKEYPNVKLRYTWVKGHSTNDGNSLADKVAAYDMSYCKQNNIDIVCLDELLEDV